MKIMAVDFGDSRTGIACCDKSEMLASPVCVINERDFEECIKKPPGRRLKIKLIL